MSLIGERKVRGKQILLVFLMLVGSNGTSSIGKYNIP